ncbi:hypothetical protein J3F84DRAFT_369055 [Trichoderma pleuroticola]
MGEASRLGKKGKSLTARRFSFGSLLVMALKFCGFDSFQLFYLSLSFSCLFYPVVHYTTAYAATGAVCFLFFSIFFFSSIWDTGRAGDTRSMFVENEFVHQGAKKKHGLLYFMRYRGYGVRGHVAICFLYP